MSDQKDRMPDNLPLIICAAVGGLFLAALTIISALTDIPAFPATLIFLIIYCASLGAAAVILRRRPAATFRLGERERASVGSLMTSTMRDIAAPAVITTGEGKIVWSNTAAENAAGSDGTLAGLEIGTVLGASTAEITAVEGNAGLRITAGGKPYRARAYEMNTPDRKYYLVMLDPLDELEAAEARADDELSVIAYVTLDNLEELSLIHI